MMNQEGRFSRFNLKNEESLLDLLKYVNRVLIIRELKKQIVELFDYP